MKARNHILETILFLSLTFSSNYALAKNEWYQVNLIVFSHVTNPTLQEENWPNKLINPSFKNVISLKPAPLENEDTSLPPPISYQLTAPNYLGLTSEAKKIARNSSYKIIKHISWLQSAESFKNNKWIHLYGGQTYDEKGQPINIDQVTNNENPSIIPSADFWELDGKIRIKKSRYFNISTVLYLTLPKSAYGGFNSNYNTASFEFQPVPLCSFNLVQQQRTTINKINYFDHPLFGMLVSITPYKQQHLLTER